MTRLAGKIALITGAANGQGRAEALLFAEHGATVIALDVNEERLHSLSLESRRLHLPIETRLFDITDGRAWQDLAESITAQHGRIDVLVNNAAIYARGLTSQRMTDGQWRSFLDVNLTGTMHGTRTIAPIMARQRSGSIVNVASIAAIRGGMGAAYSATKGGVLAFSRDVAVEYGRHNVRVNILLPGPTETDMVNAAIATPEGRINLEATIVLGRLGQPREVAYVALFLASDESSFVTGAEFVVDGGRTIG